MSVVTQTFSNLTENLPESMSIALVITQNIRDRLKLDFLQNEKLAIRSSHYLDRQKYVRKIGAQRRSHF